MLQKVLKQKAKCLSIFTKTLDSLNKLGESINVQIKYNDTEIDTLKAENDSLNAELVSIGNTASKIQEILK